MEVQIALAPALGVDAREFSRAWNETPACRAAAEARPGETTGVQYDPALIEAGLTVLSGIAMGLATNALYDLIKMALIEQGVRRRTELIQLDQPDGTKLIVIKIVEE